MAKAEMDARAEGHVVVRPTLKIQLIATFESGSLSNKPPARSAIGPN
jgi:hypothetical protein